MTQDEREKLKKERDDLEENMRTSPFVSPKDLRRIDEIGAILLSDGTEKSIRWTVKRREYHRVTSFTRDRR